MNVDPSLYSYSMFGYGAFLPPELWLDIASHCVPGTFEDLLKISQTCHLLRRVLLPIAFETLVDYNLRHLMSLPKHLRVYVRNVWVCEDAQSVVAGIEDAWFWRTVTNLALPPQVYHREITIPDDCTSSPPLKLTLVPAESAEPSSGAAGLYALLLNSPGFSNRVTHLWMRTGEPWQSLLAILNMTALTHLAVAFRGGVSGDALAAYSLCLHAVETKPCRAVMVSDQASRIDVDAFISRVKLLMRAHENLYCYAMAEVEAADVQAEWEDVVHGEEDIWQKAERVREAVLKGDRAEVVRICGEGYILAQLKRLARLL